MKEQLILYERFDKTEQSKGFGWHTEKGKKELEQKGFKFKKVKE
jgi:hypothetical protein